MILPPNNYLYFITHLLSFYITISVKSHYNATLVLDMYPCPDTKIVLHIMQDSSNLVVNQAKLILNVL